MSLAILAENYGVATGLVGIPTDTTIALSWGPVPGAATYNLYRSLTPGGEGGTPYQSGIATNSYNDTGLTEGTTYYYQVTAVVNGKEGKKSAELAVTTLTHRLLEDGTTIRLLEDGVTRRFLEH
jgi:hypothetical protein